MFRLRLIPVAAVVLSLALSGFAQASSNSISLYPFRMAVANHLRGLGCKVSSGNYKYVSGAAACPRGSGRMPFQVYNECHMVIPAESATCRWTWAPTYSQAWVTATMTATRVNGKMSVTVTQPFIWHPPQRGGVSFP